MPKSSFELLKSLCSIHAPSGEEAKVKDFLLTYISEESANWKYQPEIHQGPELQDCLILSFGKPRTAVFAHMDSVGFTVRYENQLVAVGGPDTEDAYFLTGEDSKGPIRCQLEVDEEGSLRHNFPRAIDRGTSLCFEMDFKEDEESIQSCYLDNRLGIWVALQLAKTLENGILVFSSYEEHGGGSVPFLIRYLYERWKIHQALICDITWITEGVRPGEGVALSLRDRLIPRASFINRIKQLAEASGIPYQLEVEGSGSSDGRELQFSPYSIDWCFIGAAEKGVHSPKEKVNKQDIASMLSMYHYLMQKL